MYRLIVGFFGFCADLFFRRRHLGGPPIPPSGPVVLVANHPNGLIDPLLVTRVADRPLRFLAKEPMFRMPVIGWLMRRVRALPIYRASDGHSTDSNLSIFRAVHNSLLQGDAICLFPEGLSHMEPELARLKTGAARMVLGAEAARGFELGIQIVPFGLTFRERQRFRSEVATESGDPFTATDLAAAYEADPRETVRQLTARIDERLREVTLNLERWEDLPLIEMAETIWRPDDRASEREQRVRLIAAAARELEATEPQRVARLRRRIEGFQRRLRQLGIPPDRLDRGYRPSRVARFMLRNLVALLLGSVVALIGAIVYVVPFHATRRLARVATPKDPLVSSFKLLAAVICYGIWQIALLIVIGTQVGWLWGLAAFFVLPFFGHYAAGYLTRRRGALHELRQFLLLTSRSKSDLVRRLVVERDAIADELEAAAVRYRSGDMAVALSNT